jgi:hypothetical protein
MARLNAPSPASSRCAPAPQVNSFDTLNKCWPFAKGSQNNLDETAAPWPRPVSRPSLDRSGPMPK